MQYQTKNTVMLSEKLSQPHVLQPCWDTQLAGLSADALQVALSLELFTQLGEWASADDVATRLNLDAANTGYLLELLCSVELLECQHGSACLYRNTPSSARYLDPASADYCGDALLFRHAVLRQVGQQLESLLRTGDRVEPEPAVIQRGWAQAARQQIAQEQQAVTADVACELVAAQSEFWQARRLLDLGGGPGVVAIALAKQQPDLQAVVFEYAEAAQVAQQRIVEAGLEARVSTLAGDLVVDDFGAEYDVIWCSSVLHFVPDIPAVLQRLYQALRPGGVLVCCHAEVPQQAVHGKAVLHYYLHMRMQGRHVWPSGELAQLLTQQGFSVVEQYHQVRFPVAPVNAVIARKPR
ncbi:MAG: methyltransferase domain-containing protein [Paenalcaligenes sp.]